MPGEGKINYNDIFEPGILKKFITGFKTAEKQIVASIKRIQKEANKLVFNPKDSKKFADNLKKLNTLTKQKETADKKLKSVAEQIRKAEERLLQVRQKNHKTLVKVREETNKTVREQRLGAKVAIAEAGSYNKLTASLNKNINSWKKMTKAQRENSAQGKKLSTTIKRQDSELKKLDKQLGRHQRNVGNYGSSMSMLPGPIGRVGHGISMMGNALKFIASPLGLATVGLVGFGVVIGKAIQKAIAFQKANAELASILGKSRSEIKSLNASAKILGATTSFTAEQVVRLQIEYAKLGFAEQAIIDMSKATIDLSVVSKRGADQVAQYIGSVIKMYGLLSTDATRIADVSAKAFSSTALDFDKLSHGMSIVGPIAFAMGESFEKTTAKLGALADRGLDASVSGTALRNVYLELAKEGLDWDEAMDMINNSQNKASKSLELFGKRGAVAGLILADTGDEVEKLNYKLDNAGGTAEKVANEQLMTLTGQTTLLKSAWDGFLLSIEDGEGILAQIVETVINLTTSFLKLITPTQTFADKLGLVTQEYVYQRERAEELFTATMKLTEGSDERAESIKKLNLLYLDYLPSILKENATNLELENSQKLVNNAIQENILLKQRQALLTDLTNEKIGAEQEAFRNFAKLAKDQGIDNYEQITDLYKELLRSGRDVNGNLQVTQEFLDKLQVDRKFDWMDPFSTDNISLMNTLNGVIKGVDQSTEEYEESMKLLDATMKALGLTESQIILKEEEMERKRKQRAQERFLTASISNPNASPDDALASAMALKKMRLKVAQEEYDEGILYKEEFEARKLEIENSYLAMKEALGVGNMEPDDDAVKKAEEDGKKAGESFALGFSTMEIIDPEDIWTPFIEKMNEGSVVAKTNADYQEELWRMTYEGRLQTLQDMLDAGEISEMEHADAVDAMEEEHFKQRVQRVMQYARTFQQVGNAIFEFAQNSRDKEWDDIQKQKNDELDLAQGNGEKIDEINKKYAKKEAELKTKQAKADKQKGLFNAFIGTAVGVANALPNIPLAIIAGILGALQIALIASRPIPQFYKGVKNFKGGVAEVGERGTEMIVDKAGNVSFSGDQAEHRYLEPGTDVYTHEETKQKMASLKFADRRIRPFNERMSTKKLEGLQGKQLTEQVRTNDLLGRFKWFDGKSTYDLEGNKITRV